MSVRPPEMTPAEFAVMKALWRIKRGSVAEIRAEHSRLFDSDLAYTTVMTLLGRLAAKGALHVDKARQPYSYKPAFRRESVLRARLRAFVDTVFDGQADSLVLHLLEDESLSRDELKVIENRIHSVEQSQEPEAADAEAADAEAADAEAADTEAADTEGDGADSGAGS